MALILRFPVNELVERVTREQLALPCYRDQCPLSEDETLALVYRLRRWFDRWLRHDCVRDVGLPLFRCEWDGIDAGLSMDEVWVCEACGVFDLLSDVASANGFSSSKGFATTLHLFARVRFTGVVASAVRDYVRDRRLHGVL